MGIWHPPKSDLGGCHCCAGDVDQLCKTNVELGHVYLLSYWLAAKPFKRENNRARHIRPHTDWEGGIPNRYFRG